MRCLFTGTILLLSIAANWAPANAQQAPKTINAIGAENEYADVISQIGGKFVQVSAIESDPNVDPHEFEVSPQIAGQVAAADLIVENGLGYDPWADKIAGAAPKSSRKVINVQALLKLPDSTPNPHLWFNPTTMPAVAKAIADDLTALMPDQTAYFQGNLKIFDDSLQPWTDAIAAFKKSYPNTQVAVIEPVADYLLQAAGAKIATPFTLESAVMNGDDPSPQDVTAQNDLLNKKAVKVFVYNQQVTDPLTDSFLQLAKKNGIPVVGVYETMPVPGYTYQSWMLAEITAIANAVANKTSTEKL
jgi:zinc/manganese transport system substrate-binding protein